VLQSVLCVCVSTTESAYTKDHLKSPVSGLSRHPCCRRCLGFCHAAGRPCQIDDVHLPSSHDFRPPPSCLSTAENARAHPCSENIVRRLKKTKPKARIPQSKRCTMTQNKHKKLKPGLSRPLRHPTWKVRAILPFESNHNGRTNHFHQSGVQWEI